MFPGVAPPPQYTAGGAQPLAVKKLPPWLMVVGGGIVLAAVAVAISRARSKP
jgi:hypothetical protein